MFGKYGEQLCTQCYNGCLICSFMLNHQRVNPIIVLPIGLMVLAVESNFLCGWLWDFLCWF